MPYPAVAPDPKPFTGRGFTISEILPAKNNNESLKPLYYWRFPCRQEVKKFMVGIQRKQHGIADYAYAPLVWFAPRLAGFSTQPQANIACKAAAAGALTYALLTDAEWGAAKLLPYKVHLGIDLALGIASFAAPWLLKVQHNKRARNTLLLIGAVSLTVGILSVLGTRSDAQKG